MDFSSIEDLLCHWLAVFTHFNRWSSKGQHQKSKNCTWICFPLFLIISSNSERLISMLVVFLFRFPISSMIRTLTILSSNFFSFAWDFFIIVVCLIKKTSFFNRLRNTSAVLRLGGELGIAIDVNRSKYSYRLVNFSYSKFRLFTVVPLFYRP